MTLTLLLASVSLIGCAPKTADNTSSPGDTDADAAFVKVPASTFQIGCMDGQDDCDSYETEHTVTLTQDYFVGVTEVTQGQFQAVMEYNPSNYVDCDGLGPDDCPVERVNWYQSAAYANAVSDGAGLQECYTCTGFGTNVECDVGMNPYACSGYRLLTEAEWEGAARCGTDTDYAGSDTATDVAWTAENSNSSTHTVAGLAPNACGLYDMSGNVWEWTQDGYENYPSGSMSDPSGAESGYSRVYRGGGYGNVAEDAVVYQRHHDAPIGSGNYMGFRLARSVVP